MLTEFSLSLKRNLAAPFITKIICFNRSKLLKCCLKIYRKMLHKMKDIIHFNTQIKYTFHLHEMPGSCVRAVLKTKYISNQTILNKLS